MEIATIKRGESFTFKVVLNAEYDMARLKEYYLYIGGRAMTGTVNGNTITVKLRSEDTDLMSGINKITLWLDDTILGVQKPYLGDMVVSMTNADESNSSVSEVDNALIPVTITATAITVGDIMYNYVKGDTGNGIQSIALTSTVGKVKTYTITFTDLTTTTFTVTDGADGVGLNGKSAYQVWLDLGNIGTEQDFIDSLAAGGIDLSAYLTELEAQGLYQPIGAYLTAETDPTVPAWAKEATKPTYTAAEVSGLQTELDGKVDDSQVLTNVPAGAVFTDTVYTHPATHSISEVSGLQAELDSKVDDSQVLTNVPAGAVFTDTIYTHPATHSISEVSGLQTALDNKVDDSQVLTNVPAGALFTDTIYTHPATHSISEVSGLQTELDNKVDDSQVLTNVPSGALFTDTVYTHPATHEATIIEQDATHRFVTDTEKTTWNSKADTIHNHDDRYYTEGEVNGLIAAIKGAYDAELVTSPTTGTLTLKNSTETVLDGALTTSNVFTVALPTPVSGKVNESILIFKIGATLPTITQPSGIVWRGSTPTLAINTSWTIVYEQVNTTGTTYEIWAVATKNA